MWRLCWRIGGGLVEIKVEVWLEVLLEVLVEIRMLVRVEVLWLLYVVCWYISSY